MSFLKTAIAAALGTAAVIHGPKAARKGYDKSRELYDQRKAKKDGGKKDGDK